MAAPAPPSSGSRSRYRVGFRTVQLAMILGVLLTTFLAVGSAAFAYARLAVRDLADEVLIQGVERVDLRVREVLDVAVAHGEISRRLLVDGRVAPDDAATMLRWFTPVLQAEPRFQYISFANERGEYWHVARADGDRVGIQEIRLYPSGHRWQREWDLVDGERHLVREVPDPPYDPRRRPYYAAARDAGKPTWTDSYVLQREAGHHALGVSRAIPLYQLGALVGVITVDVDLMSLSDYLRAVPLGHTGFAFLLEETASGRRVVAHPGLDQVSRPSAQDPFVIETIPASESPDPRVRAFTALVPTDLTTAGSALVPVRLTVDGRQYFGAWRRVGGDDAPPWVLCAMIPVSDVMGRVDQMTRTMAFVGSLGILIALLLGLYVARALTTTLAELEAEMRGIARFDLSPRLLAESPIGIRELDGMRSATDQMKRGLRSFGRYVPTELVRQLVVSGFEARLGASRVEITVVLADIAGFTTLVESNPPEFVLDALSEYLTEMNQAILGTQGTVCQYLGDAVQAFWGAPVRQKSHALRACRAALEMRERTRQLGVKAVAQGERPLNTRFGVCTGQALVGNIGAPDRFNYGCVGAPVSGAAWLEGLNKVYGTSILIADTTATLVRKHLVTRPVDWVLMPGHSDAVLVHELVGLPGEVSDEVKAGLDHYRNGLDAMHRGRFDDAAASFGQARAALGDGDGPCRLMLEFLETRARRAT